MNDNNLLITIDFKNIKKIKDLCIEIFCGNTKILRNNMLSGEIRKINVDNVDEFKNMSKRDIEKLSIILSAEDTIKISSNKYIISKDAFIKIINEFEQNKIVWIKKNSRKFMLLNEARIVSVNKISVDKNKVFICLENGVKLIDYNSDIVIFNNTTYVLIKDSLYIFERNFNEKIIKRFVFNRHIIGNFKYDDLILENKQDKDKAIIFKDVICIGILKLEYKKLILDLKFKYENVIIGAFSNDKIIRGEDKDYYRNYKIESNVLNKLVALGWLRSTDDVFVYKYKNDVYNAVKQLIDMDIEIFMNNKKVALEDSCVDLKINYGINWFEMDGNALINNESIKLSELIDSYDKRYFENDNYIMIFSNTLKKCLDKCSVVEDKVVLDKKFIGDIIDVSDKFKIKKIKGIENLFKYSKVKLKLSKNLNEKLFPYQKTGVKWMKNLILNGFGGCLADDMGLGKTLQAIALISDEDLKNKKVLIVVPRTLIGNWEHEMQENFVDAEYSIYYGTNRNKYNYENSNILITTYGVLAKDIELLKTIDFDIAFFDEVQYVKNSQSKTRKCIKALKVKNLITLSGTPYENNIGELWSIVDIANDGYLGTKQDFIKMYKITDNKIDNLERLKRKIYPFILRRNKEDVLKQLPNKLEKIIYCDMENKQRDLYDAMLIKINKMMLDNIEDEKMIVLNGIMFLREICCHPKLIKNSLYEKCDQSIKVDVIKDVLKNIISKNKKVAIFSQFTRFLRILNEELQNEEYKTYYLDGKTKNRDNVIADFEKDSKGVFLISIKAGGVGINLVSAQYVILCDPWWNPAVEKQAEDRIYRIGQLNDVTIMRLIVRNSVEEKVKKLQDSKKLIAENIFDNSIEASNYTIKDLKELLI